MLNQCYYLVFVLFNINLAGTQIGNKGFQHLAELMKKTENLEEINLSWNKADDEGIVPLANEIITNNSLIRLKLCMIIFYSIGNNNIGIAGGRALADALIQCVTLTYIDLCNNFLSLVDNRIKDEGAKAFAEAIKNITDKDIYLDLSYISYHCRQK